jgi:hypothetical protein
MAAKRRTMRYYTPQSFAGSLTHEKTPEGYLLARSVPIARTGTMLYAAGEVPIRAVDGLIRIERMAGDVFAQSTIASFEGKPICLDHPSVDVNPSNWSQLAKGVVQNVWRGTGLEDDFLVADLLITDAAAIQQVRDGLRELSAGYDADYRETEPGQGRQFNIVGNHLALVEKGRCGSRCAIGDTMTKLTWVDRLRAAFKTRDEAEFETALSDKTKDEAADESEEEKKKKKDEEESKTSDTLKRYNDTLAALETRDAKRVKDEAEAEESEEEKKKKKDEEDAEGKTSDSAALAEAAQDTFARAEILSPGLHMPTFDAKATPDKTRDALCVLKRKALSTAFDGRYRDIVTPFLGATPDFKTLTCDAVASAFLGASEIVRRENNAQAKVTFDAGKQAAGVANTISSINARNAAFWKRN